MYNSTACGFGNHMIKDTRNDCQGRQEGGYTMDFVQVAGETSVRKWYLEQSIIDIVIASMLI